jgi:hypothetical protein
VCDTNTATTCAVPNPNPYSLLGGLYQLQGSLDTYVVTCSINKTRQSCHQFKRSWQERTTGMARPQPLSADSNPPA